MLLLLGQSCQGLEVPGHIRQQPQHPFCFGNLCRGAAAFSRAKILLEEHGGQPEDKDELDFLNVRNPDSVTFILATHRYLWKNEVQGQKSLSGPLAQIRFHLSTRPWQAKSIYSQDGQFPSQPFSAEPLPSMAKAEPVQQPWAKHREARETAAYQAPGIFEADFGMEQFPWEEGAAKEPAARSGWNEPAKESKLIGWVGGAAEPQTKAAPQGKRAPWPSDSFDDAIFVRLWPTCALHPVFGPFHVAARCAASCPFTLWHIALADEGGWRFPGRSCSRQHGTQRPHE